MLRTYRMVCLLREGVRRNLLLPGSQGSSYAEARVGSEALVGTPWVSNLLHQGIPVDRKPAVSGVVREDPQLYVDTFQGSGISWMVWLPQPPRRSPPDSQGRKVEGLLPRTERSLPDLADPRNSISHKKGELLKRFSFFMAIFIQNIAQYEKTNITDAGLVYGLRLRWQQTWHWIRIR